MKKFLFTILLISTLSLSACSKQQDSTAFPEDLIVVLPDGKELSLYMPHDDAAEILGPADSVVSYAPVGTFYVYEDLKLSIGYNEELLAYLSIKEDSPCILKNGLSSSSGKSDFVQASDLLSNQVSYKMDTIINPAPKAAQAPTVSPNSRSAHKGAISTSDIAMRLAFKAVV